MLGLVKPIFFNAVQSFFIFYFKFHCIICTLSNSPLKVSKFIYARVYLEFLSKWKCLIGIFLPISWWQPFSLSKPQSVHYFKIVAWWNQSDLFKQGIDLGSQLELGPLGPDSETCSGTWKYKLEFAGKCELRILSKIWDQVCKVPGRVPGA